MSRSPPQRGPVSAEGEDGDGGAGTAASASRAALCLGSRRTRDPSSSRPRSGDAIFPEHFVESVAIQVAIDAARSSGRLDAAPALVAVFQYHSYEREKSREGVSSAAATPSSL